MKSIKIASIDSIFKEEQGKSFKYRLRMNGLINIEEKRNFILVLLKF